jgi:hypothetical protein
MRENISAFFGILCADFVGWIDDQGAVQYETSILEKSSVPGMATPCASSNCAHPWKVLAVVEGASDGNV